MGNVNKMMTSKEEMLNYHINRRQYGKIDQILSKNPELLDKPLLKDTKHNLLMRATFTLNYESVVYVLGKGANPNTMTPRGQTALTIAIKKNKLQIVKKLIQSGADVNLVSKLNDLKPIDLAVLQGVMEISKIIFNKMDPKELKQPFEYEEIAKKFSYRYVNYKVFLKILTSQQPVNLQQNNYLIKEKPQLYDPVPDPRQSWGQWLKRNVDFKDAPMVQRSSLPAQLQPQNRKLGKLDIFINNWVQLQAHKKANYKPKEGRQVMSQMNDLVQKMERKKQNAPQYQSAL